MIKSENDYVKIIENKNNRINFYNMKWFSPPFHLSVLTNLQFYEKYIFPEHEEIYYLVDNKKIILDKTPWSWEYKLIHKPELFFENEYEHKDNMLYFIKEIDRINNKNFYELFEFYPDKIQTIIHGITSLMDYSDISFYVERDLHINVHNGKYCIKLDDALSSYQALYVCANSIINKIFDEFIEYFPHPDKLWDIIMNYYNIILL